MPRTSKPATAAEQKPEPAEKADAAEEKVEEKPSPMTRGDSTPFALAVAEKVLKQKGDAVARDLKTLLAGVEKVEGGYRTLAAKVLDLRMCFTKTVALSARKSMEVHDIDGKSPAYRTAYGAVITPLLKDLDPKLQEQVKERIAYHAQTLRDVWVAEGRIDKAEVQALGLKSSKQSRAAERAAAKRAETAAALAEAEQVVAATRGDSKAAMEQVLRFLVDVRERLDAAETLGAFGGEGYTAAEFARWATSVVVETRALAESFERKGFGMVFTKPETKPEKETKPATTRKTRAA